MSDVDWLREECRRCRDERYERVPAAGIVWGKLIKPEALGPRCLRCIEEQLGWHAASSVVARSGIWAIYPLPIERASCTGKERGTTTPLEPPTDAVAGR